MQAYQNPLSLSNCNISQPIFDPGETAIPELRFTLSNSAPDTVKTDLVVIDNGEVIAEMPGVRVAPADTVEMDIAVGPLSGGEHNLTVEARNIETIGGPAPTQNVARCHSCGH